MARKPGTDRHGYPFSKQIIDDIWRRAQEVGGIDSNNRRKDRCGAWIEKDRYGVHEENGTGWEIDHIKPVSQGGSDELGNLQPLQWENNKKKGESYPHWWGCSTEAESG